VDRIGLALVELEVADRLRVEVEVLLLLRLVVRTCHRGFSFRIPAYQTPQPRRFFPGVLHFGPMAKPQGEKLIVDNRRARHDYHLTDKVEAGLVLAGTEVKALRDGKATLQQSYAEVRNGEAWLVGLHIPEYGQGNRANHDPDRPRKLLLHRREIDRLYGVVREKGLTLVPTRLYFKDGRVKAEIAVARGKELRDKRRTIADRDARRQLERELKSRR
jgi:SsrA-binding protein